MGSENNSVICDEVFEEGCQPSNEEIIEYAVRIGISPVTEPHLLYLARDGLMQALPPDYKVCFNKTHGIYYFNTKSKTSQWDHPLDGEFKRIVEETRLKLQQSHQQPDEDLSLVDSGIRSLQGLEESQTNTGVSELHNPKMDREGGNRLVGMPERRLAPLVNLSTDVQPNVVNQIDLNIRQPNLLGGRLSKSQLTTEPIQGFTVSGTGSKFLKSNSRNIIPVKNTDEQIHTTADSSASASISVKGILRDSSLTEVKYKSIAPDHGDADAEDRKSVRFNLDKLDSYTGIGSSEESSSAESPNDDIDDKRYTYGKDWDLMDPNVGVVRLRDIPPMRPSTKPPIPSKASLRTQFSLDEYRRPALHSLNVLGRTASTDSANDERSSINTLFDRKIEKNLMPVKPLYEDSDSESMLDSSKNTSDIKLGTVASNLQFFGRTKVAEVQEDKTEPGSIRKQPSIVRSQVASQNLLFSNQQRTVIPKRQAENQSLGLDESKQNQNNSEQISEVQQSVFQKQLDEELQKRKSELNSKLQQSLQIEEEKYQQKYENERKKFEALHKQKMEWQTLKFQQNADELQAELESKHNLEVSNFEQKLQRDFEEKQKEISFKHRTAVDILQKNHSEIFDDLERDLKTEADLLRKEHNNNLAQVKIKLEHELEVEKQRMRESGESHQFEKLRCEKRLLEDKYRCLKEKYTRLKTDVKLRLERQSQQRRHHPNTTTTGSETDHSFSKKHTLDIHDPRSSMSVSVPTPTVDQGKPPASPSAPRHQNFTREKTPKEMSKASASKEKMFNAPAHYVPHLNQHQLDDTTSISQSDTTVSNNFSRSKVLPLQPTLGDNGNSDSEALHHVQENNNHSRDTRKKLFTRMKSASTSRLNSGNRVDLPHHQRPCSPMDSLRRQLQKLEDLEDQFPDNILETTYHLRYPFKDVHLNKDPLSAPDSSSELEFFKHRIHMERDSVRRAKDSLRTQRTNFRVRQREIKQRHKSAGRHSLDHLIHEAKELTDMEVRLHRTRALLGEKVIRLRHLEQSLQRVFEKDKPTAEPEINNKHQLLAVVHKEDTTFSDLSSHSSSGFSSTDYATETNLTAANKRNEATTSEPSADILQSLEYLNSEIKEIWEILSKQQRTQGLPPPPIMIDWSKQQAPLGMEAAPPIIPASNMGAAKQTSPGKPIIPTFFDRLETYRQFASNKGPNHGSMPAAGLLSTFAANTFVSQAPAAGGYTSSLVERTQDLRKWLKQAKTEHEMLGAGGQQTDL